jgi:NIMA (never in mitosis gene a)-related kinase
MEYADNGDIFSLIKKHQKSQELIDEDDIWRIFIQSVRGLKALHDINIMHRDLKVIKLTILLNHYSVQISSSPVRKKPNWEI